MVANAASDEPEHDRTPRSGRPTGWQTSLRTWADRCLPLWFLLWTTIRLQQLSWDGTGWDTSFIGRDFRIYRNAGMALWQGDDPWAAFERWNGTDWHFAALPITAQLFVPFTFVPESVGFALFLTLSVAAVWLAFRRLGLPAWWLLFPPLTEGLLATNPQVLLFALLVIGGPVARAIGTALKVYAVVPTLAHRDWRGSAAAAIVLGVSVVASPGLWAAYISQFAAVSLRLAQESVGGVSAALVLDPRVFGASVPPDGPLRYVPGLVLYGLVVSLVLIAAMRDVRAAGWVAVPLLWPAAEYHLATMAIPVARRLSIWVIAVATLPTYLLGLILLAYEIAARHPAMVAEPPPVGLVRWLRTLPDSFRPASPQVSSAIPADTRPTTAS